MINVLMLFSSQVVDGSPRLCDKDKPRATNNTLLSKPLNGIIESQNSLSNTTTAQQDYW